MKNYKHLAAMPVFSCQVCTVPLDLFILNSLPSPATLGGSLQYNILAILLKGSFGRK